MRELAETLVLARLRIPLRQLLTTAVDRLSAENAEVGPEALPSIVSLMNCSGRGSMFHGELFEFCNANVRHLTAKDMALYLYETGRHGLRARHFAEAAVGRATELVPQMSLEEVMLAWQGLARFSKDWSRFYVAARTSATAGAAQLSANRLILLLRVARDLRHLPGFADLNAAACEQLTKQSLAGALSPSQEAFALMYCVYTPKFQAPNKALVMAVDQRWSDMDDLSSLRLVEVVDVMATFASWGLKNLPLLDKLNQILVDRSIEMKYTGNVALWIRAAQAMARTGHLDAAWAYGALDLARDKGFVANAGFFLQCDLLSAFSKLHVFDEDVYRNLAELILSDIGLLTRLEHLAPVLQACAAAGYYHEGLFDAGYDLLLRWLEAEEVDVSARDVQTSLISVVWSLAMAGYHQKYDSFAAALDYVYFRDLVSDRAMHVRRLAEIADLAVLEAPQLARHQCQFPERLEAARSDERSRRVAIGRPPSEPALLRDIRETLQAAGWAYEPFAMPDDTSPCYVGVSLEPQLRQKVGLLIAGRRELWPAATPGGADGACSLQEPRRSGELELAARLLRGRGWRIEVLSASRWQELGGQEERIAFLQQLTA
eukprot:TRINITY_DN2321_c0_g2_i1.p1 TRINITY_DN2321_c0_g2~~TRINITY_DN2321_c0_g2_i1.p1  ORF type:complete len:602 (-),score=151.64 TRINITY_DN2321_c0_g2_i1:49-1854(-)